MECSITANYRINAILRFTARPSGGFFSSYIFSYISPVGRAVLVVMIVKVRGPHLFLWSSRTN